LLCSVYTLALIGKDVYIWWCNWKRLWTKILHRPPCCNMFLLRGDGRNERHCSSFFGWVKFWRKSDVWFYASCIVGFSSWTVNRDVPTYCKIIKTKRIPHFGHSWKQKTWNCDWRSVNIVLVGWWNYVLPKVLWMPKVFNVDCEPTNWFWKPRLLRHSNNIDPAWTLRAITYFRDKAGVFTEPLSLLANSLVCRWLPMPVTDNDLSTAWKNFSKILCWPSGLCFLKSGIWEKAVDFDFV